MVKTIVKLKIIVIILVNTRGAVHSIRNLKIGIPKWISLVFHNGSNYDYHVIIKKLAKEFEKRI